MSISKFTQNKRFEVIRAIVQVDNRIKEELSIDFKVDLTRYKSMNCEDDETEYEIVFYPFTKVDIYEAIYKSLTLKLNVSDDIVKETTDTFKELYRNGDIIKFILPKEDDNYVLPQIDASTLSEVEPYNCNIHNFFVKYNEYLSESALQNYNKYMNTLKGGNENERTDLFGH